MKRRDFISRVVMGGAVAFCVPVKLPAKDRRREFALGRMQRVVDKLNVQLERFAYSADLTSQECRHLGEFYLEVNLEVNPDDHTEDAINYKVGPI